MTTITEEWARNAPAGPELDRVCAEWMGWSGKDDRTPDGSTFDVYARKDGGHMTSIHPASFSSDWSAAGPLLEAMRLDVGVFGVPEFTPKWDCGSLGQFHQHMSGNVTAPDPCLAIARACAVLVARGISREDLG